MSLPEAVLRQQGSPSCFGSDAIITNLSVTIGLKKRLGPVYLGRSRVRSAGAAFQSWAAIESFCHLTLFNECWQMRRRPADLLSFFTT